MEMCELDSEVYESCASRSGNISLYKDDDMKTMDFEECSLNEDLFNESVKNRYHSTMLFSKIDTVVLPYSDDEDMEVNNVDECSFSGKIKSEKRDDINSISLIPLLQKDLCLKPQLKNKLDVTQLAEKKSSSKCNERSILVIDSSLENSPAFIRSSVNHCNRKSSESDDEDLNIENVSRKSVSACDNRTHNVSNKSVNKHDSSGYSYFHNINTQNIMECEENKHSSIFGCNGILNKSLAIDDNNIIASSVEVKSNNSQSRHSDVVIINSDSDESDIEHYSANNSTRLASGSEQDENASTASVVYVKSYKPQSRPSDVILINSDSDEDDVQHGQTEYCQKLKTSTLHGTSDNAADMFSMPVAGNDLTTQVESFLAENERLKLQVAEALRAIANSKAELRTVDTDALPDKGLHLQINLHRHEEQLQKLQYQERVVTSGLSNLLDCPSRMSQQMESVQQAIPNKKQNHYVKPAWSNLPTSTTNVADLTGRALETHKTQQALTLSALKTLHKSLKSCPSVNIMSEDPEALEVKLMPHQKYALSWLLWREKNKPSGGILADDMGLGKTLSMISLVLKSNEEKLKKTESNDAESDDDDDVEQNAQWNVSSVEKKMRKGKTLIVCPATLLGQWESEINKRVQPGVLKVELHHGANREKKARRLARRDIVISTYSIVMRDFGEMDSKEKAIEKGPLFHIRWERVILDEAHQVRNHKSKTAVAVCNLSAKYRWALTGTPVHNKELDLFALLKFLRCSPFDDINVWRKWVDNHDTAGLQRLNTITKSVMLRRTKKELQEKGSLQTLKDKSESLIYVKLDNEELNVYKKVLDFSKTLFAQYLYQKAEKENMLSNMPVCSNVNRYLRSVENLLKNHPELEHLHRHMANMPDVKHHVVLVLLLRLRQICCHPSLMKSMLDEEIYQQDGIDNAEGLDLDIIDRMDILALDNYSTLTRKLSPDNPVFAEDRPSSKVRCMLTTLQEVLCTRDKVVIVSQWTSMLNIVHSRLQEQKINCALLTGSVPVKQRMVIVDDFNREHCGAKVLLLSLTAGGVGLNLVGANHLMLLDLHWNPQLETQACDRVYRVGQKKSVKIYKFICSDTIEENILQLQKKKLALADNVLTGAKLSQMSKLTLNDLKMLFNFS